MNLLRRLAFNFWYFRSPPWDTGISPPELVELIRTHTPGRALDLGCGTGTNAITLARHGWDVTGVDFALPAIRQGRKKARQAGVRVNLQVGDVTQLKGISGPFDLVLDIGCFHGLSAGGREAYLDRIDTLLATNGTYLVYLFLQSDEGSGSGVTEAEIHKIAARFRLARRQDGSERGQRPSAWLTFQR